MKAGDINKMVEDMLGEGVVDTVKGIIFENLLTFHVEGSLFVRDSKAFTAWYEDSDRVKLDDDVEKMLAKLSESIDKLNLMFRETVLGMGLASAMDGHGIPVPVIRKLINRIKKDNPEMNDVSIFGVVSDAPGEKQESSTTH